MIKHKISRKWIYIWIGILLTLAVAFWPTNYYIEAPGSTDQISNYIQDSAKHDQANPNFYLVTVSERPAGVGDYLLSFFSKNETRISKKELLGNQNNRTYQQMQKYFMENSQNQAIYYAAKKAGISHKMQFLGVNVINVLSNSSFKGKLQPGDLIVAANNHQFRSSNSFMNYIQSLKKTSKIKIKVLRGKNYKTFTGRLVKLNNGKYGIGIELFDHTKVMTKPEIKINTQDIGGPSAGLMMSLVCYQLFTKENLSPKNKIAGTGTIDKSGHVGMIGGVDKKVVAASRSGMKVFFVPSEQPQGVRKDQTNYAEALKKAKKIHSKMKIIPVKRFDDALNYLIKYEKD
ncbi:PDZ domain-containing protein [Lactobacillus sp. PV037]|uniref:SepM family pheromone-processing serine protease n=1 Tax=unclassified Lactobacillus TaxID=2620435 RepID=UPI00223F84A8|nr:MULTISPECIES: SepM family pheromone-processing serine protease [unclassified Lactobacillus]QNQ82434.1 PDZ domain-containing protein [Lactobacillus sp. PV012]QNQ83453.1 PDZ domain-containing protein [Lactobacillus sp. PV037]